jgi:ADP-heptose:LPS heptosyltransferase
MTATGSKERPATRILVVKLGAFGDIVLADGALRDIREHHRDAHITLLTRKGFAPLLQRCPWVDTVVVDDNAPRWRIDRMLALRQRLHSGSFDAAYDLQNSRRSWFYRRWLSAGSPTWSIERQPRAIGCSVPARHATQLRAAGITPHWCEQPAPDWIATGVEHPFVVLLPGSSARHPHKRWPHYAGLASRLTGDGLLVASIPGIEEPGIAAGFDGIVLKRDGQVLTLPELAGVLQRAACVIGNDSGPTHLAACLGTPTVALFETASPARISTAIESRGAACLDASVVADITIERVLEAVQRQLGRPR